MQIRRESFGGLNPSPATSCANGPRPAEMWSRARPRLVPPGPANVPRRLLRGGVMGERVCLVVTGQSRPRPHFPDRGRSTGKSGRCCPERQRPDLPAGHFPTFLVLPDACASALAASIRVRADERPWRRAAEAFRATFALVTLPRPVLVLCYLGKRGHHGRRRSAMIGLRRPGDGLAESNRALRPLVEQGMGNCRMRRLVDKKDRLNVFQSVRMFDSIDITNPGSGHGR